MEIYLVRHTSVNVAKGTCYGQTDVALAATFTEELALIQKALPQQFDAVYSSPLTRCTQLASALSAIPANLSTDLLEMHFGDWENQNWNDIDQTALTPWMEDFVNVRTPNGEALTDLYQRITNFIAQLRTEKHQHVLIVAHAGPIRCFLAAMLGIPLANIFKLNIAYGHISHIKLADDAALDSVLALHHT